MFGWFLVLFGTPTRHRYFFIHNVKERLDDRKGKFPLENCQESTTHSAMCWSLNNPLWGQKGREGTYWTLKDKRVLLQKGSILHFESTNAMHLFTYLMDEEFLVLSHLLSTKDCGFRHLLACLSRDSMNSNTLTKVDKFTTVGIGFLKSWWMAESLPSRVAASRY